jgi:glycosyltransferase involved in cell wall biosynthesis
MNASHDSDSRQVVFAYIGTLDYRARLKKQIASLRDAGFDCNLVLGDLGERPIDPASCDYPVEVIRVPIGHGRIAWFFWQMRFAWLAGRRIAAGSAGTVVCVSLESLLAGVLAKRRRPGLRLVFDSNELHIESYMSRLKRLVWRPIQKFALRYCDVVFQAEANRLKYFGEQYPVGSAEQVVIENFPHFVESLPDRDWEGPLRVLYLGALGEDRYTFDLIDAFLSLGGPTQLDLVGFARDDFAARLKERYPDRPGPNVRILPAIPSSEIPALLRDYHIGVALYRNTGLNNYYCAPNKVYDYLMHGMPVITNDYPGLRTVIEGNRVGACIAEVDEASLGNALEAIVVGRRWENITPELRRRYSWEQQEERLLAVFDPAAPSSPPSASTSNPARSAGPTESPCSPTRT